MYHIFCHSDEKLRQAVVVLPLGHILRLMSKFDKDADTFFYYAIIVLSCNKPKSVIRLYMVS